MRTKYLWALLLPILALSLTLCIAEEPKATNPQQDAMMKAWMEFATPGAPQKAMQNMVGTWDTSVKSYMDPAAPPMESKGTSTFVSLMDGRYIQETSEGTFNGMPFHGQGTFGYDNMQKKYVGTWIDNFGTGIMVSTGSSSDGGKTVNWSGTASDPMTGKVQTYRSVMTMLSQDQYRFEMFGPGPDGKEVKAMEMIYNRKK